MDWQSKLEHDLYGAAFLAVGVLLVFALCEMLHRLEKASIEHTRKLSHVSAGLLVLSIPWLIESAWVVSGLAFGMCAVLALGEYCGALNSIHGVKRKTWGAYCYPVAIAVVFALSGGQATLFCIPVLIMAVADTGAALMGKESGHTRYRVLDGHRSLEGSAAFFGLSFSMVLMGLALAGASAWPEVLLVAMVVAIITTAVEAISIRGSDNLLIPYVGWLVLERSLRLGLDELSVWMTGMLFAMALLVATSSMARLTVAGGVAAFVLVSFSYALVGAHWLLPLLVLFGLYLALSSRKSPLDYDKILPATGASLLVVCLQAHMPEHSLYLPYLVTLGLGALLAFRSPERMSSMTAPPAVALAGGGLFWMLSTL